MLALARVASSSNSWSGAQQENSVRNDSDCVRKKLSARNFRQVSCLKVQSPRVVFVELPEQHIEILLSREQTQIDEGFFHLPLIQSPVDSGIHGADQRSSDPCASIFSAPRHASWHRGSGSFNGILTRSCPCRTCRRPCEAFQSELRRDRSLAR